jgi:hypothetical protein
MMKQSGRGLLLLLSGVGLACSTGAPLATSTAGGSAVFQPSGSGAIVPSGGTGAIGASRAPTTSVQVPPLGAAGRSAIAGISGTAGMFGSAGTSATAGRAASGGAGDVAASGGTGATAGSFSSGGTGGTGGAGGAAGAAGAVGSAAGGGNSLTGTLGALGPVQPVLSGWATTNGLETLIYLSTAPLTCAQMMMMGTKWLSSLPPGSQVIEIVIRGTATVGTVPVGFLQGEVNYAEGSKSSSYEVTATGGSINITKAVAKSVFEGTIMATYAMGSVMGTFHADWCQGGSEY